MNCPRTPSKQPQRFSSRGLGNHNVGTSGLSQCMGKQMSFLLSLCIVYDFPSLNTGRISAEIQFIYLFIFYAEVEPGAELSQGCVQTPSS